MRLPQAAGSSPSPPWRLPVYPLAANATSAMTVSPSNLGSVLGFQSQLQTPPPRNAAATLLQREVAIAALGGLIGAIQARATPPV